MRIVYWRCVFLALLFALIAAAMLHARRSIAMPAGTAYSSSPTALNETRDSHDF